MRQLDHSRIAELRALGSSWQQVAEEVGGEPETLRGAHSRWRRSHPIDVEAARARARRRSAGRPGSAYDPVDDADDEAPASVTKQLTAEQVQRITSLPDLLQFFKVDLARYEVRDFRVNTWEQHSAAAGIVPLYQVRANLIPRADEDTLRQLVEELRADMATHAPTIYQPIARRSFGDDSDPVLFELAIHDPHIGMLAWGREVGESYDTRIAVDDYRAAVEHLLSFALLYPTDRILYVVGHDTLHVDGPAPTAKGNNRGGATTGGTAQDVDGRRSKVFTAARRAIVEGIDRAREIAPVDVVVVPGNHDENEMYRMGEVLAAWYRLDPEVRVHYGPAKRKFYDYGKNAFLLTHGEEYRRQRDSLPLIFATECPPDMWARTTHREIHTGHNHIGMAGRYVPTADLNETRGIRTRSLPGLTPEDSWHSNEGYKHRRTATALAFRRSGGLAGFHEFSL